MRKITIDLNSISQLAIFNNTVRQGENLATQIEFILDSEFAGYKYLMLLQLNNKAPVSTSELIPVDGKVSYILTNATTNETGTLRVELHAYDDTGALIKTAYINLKVAQSINGLTEVMPESYVPWYITAVEQASIATTKATEAVEAATNIEQQVNNWASKTVVTLNHQFVDATARDAYFIDNPAELADKLFIKVGTGYQQYIDEIWEDVSAVVIEQLIASQQLIVDAGGLYATDNVEDALQEVATNLDEHKLDYTEHLNSTMPHKIENLKTGKTYRYGYQISAEGIPQIKFEEVI